MTVVDERSKTGNPLVPVLSLERPDTRSCSDTRLTPDVVYEPVRYGAVGILLKEIAPAGVVRTLRAAANGEAPLPRDLVAGLLNRIFLLNASISARPPITTLSSRELYISEFTAERHAQNVLNKPALHRRRDAATRFREEVNAAPPGALPFESEQS